MRSSHEAVGMKTGYAAIVAIVALLAAVAVPVCVEDSNAIAYLDTPDAQEFDNMSGGTLKFTVNNTRGGSFEMDVSVFEDGKEVASEKGIQIPANQKTEISVDMSDFTSVGTHTLTVKCTPEGQFEKSEFTVTVDVKKNLLSDWITYVVILIVVIVIAVFAYLKIRDSPKKKTEMTFEQLEEQRKAEMATKTEKKKVKEAAPTTERQRYLADKKKKKE